MSKISNNLLRAAVWLSDASACMRDASACMRDASAWTRAASAVIMAASASRLSASTLRLSVSTTHVWSTLWPVKYKIPIKYKFHHRCQDVRIHELERWLLYLILVMAMYCYQLLKVFLRYRDLDGTHNVISSLLVLSTWCQYSK